MESIRKDFRRAANLWANWVKAKHSLLSAGLIRSYKPPEADFSEWIVATYWKGKLLDNKSFPAYDVVAGDKRIQVKSIAKMPGNPHGYIVTKKDKKNDPYHGATHYAFVFFTKLIPDEIFLVPESFVRQFSKKEIKRHDLINAGYKVDIDLSIFRKAVVSENR
jgi:hypothetical protein